MYNYQPKDYELTAFHYALGKAVSEAHKFEYLLAIILCVVRHEEFESMDTAWEALDTDFKKTLGKLISSLNEQVYFVETFRYHLAELVHERNWVVHKLPRAMYIYLREKYEFDRLVSRLCAFKESCSSLRSMLEEWFFGKEEYKSKIDALPLEILQSLSSMKKV